jgi:YVTN family beta-propeller protein
MRHTEAFMKKLSLSVLVFALAACRPTATNPEFGSSSGSLALSRGGDLLYVAESDTNALVVLDAKTMDVVARVPVGEWPERVAVGPDDRIFVSNRFSRSVSVIEKGSWEAPANEIAVGAEPVGLSVSPDGKRLAVANSASGTVSLVDLASLEVREADAGLTVTGVRFVGENKVYATLYKGGNVRVIDATSAQAVGQIDLTLTGESLGFEKGDCFDCGMMPMPGSMDTRTPNLVPDVIVSPAGDRVYIPHVQTKSDPVATEQPGGYSGEGAIVPAVAAAVTTVDPVRDEVKPHIANAASQEAMVPPAMFRAEGEPMAGPVAAALDPRGAWLFVANHNSNNVTVVSTGGGAARTGSAQGIFAIIRVGAGPKGIAVSPDGMTAYVHNAFDYTVSVIRASSDGATLTVDQTAKIVETSPVPADVQRGRKLFHDASDFRITNPRTGGIACASCHPGGRDDGRTWQLTTQGLRNTPSLAGKHLRETKPYHWDGEFDEFKAFQHIVQDRMGGSGLAQQDFDDILAFLDSKWNPGPDNPNRAASGELTLEQARGRIIFEGKANCGSCHGGPAHTDNKFYDVARFTPGALGRDTLQNGQVNTPSLIGLFYTAPYLHDGTALTLEARINADVRGEHGKTAGLTAEEKADLLAYLKTL